MHAGEVPAPGEGTPHSSHGDRQTESHTTADKQGGLGFGSTTGLASASALATDAQAPQTAPEAQGVLGPGSGFGSTQTGLASALAPDAQAPQTASAALTQMEDKLRGYWPSLKLTGLGSGSGSGLAQAAATQPTETQTSSSSSSSGGSSQAQTQETHKDSTAQHTQDSTAPYTQETHKNTATRIQEAHKDSTADSGGPDQNQPSTVDLPLGGAQATQQDSESQGPTQAAHPRQNTPKRDRNERSTSVTPVTKEETEPARRSSLFGAGGHQRAEEVPQRNWFSMTEVAWRDTKKNNEENDITRTDFGLANKLTMEDIAAIAAETSGTSKDTETTIDGMTNELITSIATHLGGIIAETTPPEQQTTLPEAQEIPDLLKALGGLSDTYKQQFAGICIRYPDWHKRVTNTMMAEINRKTGCTNN